MKIIHERKYFYMSLIREVILSETFSSIVYGDLEWGVLHCILATSFNSLRISFSYRELFRTIGRKSTWKRAILWFY